MFFERKEIKQVIGCMLLCFPEYIRKLQQRDFPFDFENLYEYYDTQCIAAAKELILEYKDTFDLSIQMFSIDDFGGWNEVYKKYFEDDGLFDQLYEK